MSRGAALRDYLVVDGMSFGDYLQALLDVRNLRQADVADMAYLSRAFVHRLIAGTRRPERHSVDVLAEALNLDGQEMYLFFAKAGFFPPNLTVQDGSVHEAVARVLEHPKIAPHLKREFSQLVETIANRYLPTLGEKWRLLDSTD